MSEDDDSGVTFLDLLLPLAQHWKLLVAGPLLLGIAALAATYLVKPTFTSRTAFVPPQQQQSGAASALASLGALAGLAGATAGIKSPADQYVALLQSTTVSDRLIDEFKLMQVYDQEYRINARKELAGNVRIGLGKKDGLIAIEVDDTDPVRAAAIANRYVDELRRLTGQLALTEAQQRRVFFEAQLSQTRTRLAEAQKTLQSGGFNPGALKTEPKAAAESYARLQAETTATEVRLQTLRRTLADGAPEVQRLQGMLTALRAQLLKAQSTAEPTPDADYVGRYREFKYQETLFEMLARQYELARVDESREGALIQVVDIATPAERKSKPKRALIAAAATLSAFMLLALVVIVRHFWREAAANPVSAARVARVRGALRRG